MTDQEATQWDLSLFALSDAMWFAEETQAASHLFDAYTCRVPARNLIMDNRWRLYYLWKARACAQDPRFVSGIDALRVALIGEEADKAMPWTDASFWERDNRAVLADFRTVAKNAIKKVQP